MAKTYTGSGINPEGKLAATNPKSISLAIAARCWQCVGGGADPAAVEQIKKCTIGDCALYPVRPYQAHGFKANIEVLRRSAPVLPPGKVASPIDRARANPSSRALAVRACCYDCMGGQPVGRPNPNGNVKKHVGECATIRCALWDARPWKAGVSDDTREERETENA